MIFPSAIYVIGCRLNFFPMIKVVGNKKLKTTATSISPEDELL
jgi:hypothetical protein